MSFTSWMDSIRGKRVSKNYDTAMKIADETIAHLREARASPDPIRALLADVFFQNHDPALIADAFEAHQEANIYKGDRP